MDNGVEPKAASQESGLFYWKFEVWGEQILYSVGISSGVPLLHLYFTHTHLEFVFTQSFMGFSLPAIAKLDLFAVPLPRAEKNMVTKYDSVRWLAQMPSHALFEWQTKQGVDQTIKTILKRSCNHKSSDSKLHKKYSTHQAFLPPTQPTHSLSTHDYTPVGSSYLPAFSVPIAVRM